MWIGLWVLIGLAAWVLFSALLILGAAMFSSRVSDSKRDGR